MTSSKPRKHVHPALGFGLNFAVGMALSVWLGSKMKEKTGKEYWILVGMFLGLAYGGYELWKIIVMSNKKDQNEDPEISETR